MSKPENSSQYPIKGNRSEDKAIEDELRDLKLKFPSKKFRIIGKNGNQKIEVVLDW